LPHIHLFPKVGELLDTIEHSPARVLGVGGGRGAGKSKGLDDIALTLGMETPKTLMAVVMRNYDQVRRYHIEPIIRSYPEIEGWMHYSGSKLMIPNGSQIDFTYAESLADVERRFRSANYKYIFCDQAEQFTGTELREMMLANRGAEGAKTILSFNMGGIGIQDLRNWFYAKKFNERDDPNNYQFIHVYPWDNLTWALPALKQDGLTEEDYFAWDHDQRFEYFIRRTDYGKQLNALDDAVRARDLLGSWESLEGAYFGRVFDYDKTMISQETAERLIRPWDHRWLSTDWGKSHYCSTHWHAKTTLTPQEARRELGWEVSKPIQVVVTYRRLIVNEMTSSEVGRAIVDATPRAEREQLRSYFLSPDAFGSRDSDNTIADYLGKEFKPYGLPQPEVADNQRIPGWQLMYALLNATRLYGTKPELRKEQPTGDTCWLISSECPEALETIPILMRNSKDLDDVVKTDKGQAVMAMDVADDLRYGLQSMLGSGVKPEKVKHAEKLMSMHSHTGYSQELTFAEIAFRNSQNQPEFSVSGRRRR